MRKLILRFKYVLTGKESAEDYDASNVIHPQYFGRRRNKKMISVKTRDDAEAWGRAVIEWFNSTCRPGESRRELLSVKLIEEDEQCGD
jgi:hypothetical protein